MRDADGREEMLTAISQKSADCRWTASSTGAALAVVEVGPSIDSDSRPSLMAETDNSGGSELPARRWWDSR